MGQKGEKMLQITSKENQLIKHIIKLKEKKYRKEYNEYIIEGVKIVEEAIEEKAKIKQIIISEDAINSELVQKHLKEKLQKIAKVSLSDTNSETKENSLKEYWKKIEETIDDYAQYQVIITDRYHGTIFALIANTPEIILKTTDHKVVTGADWFEGVYEDYVYVVNDLEEASQVAQQIVTGFEYRKLPSYFKEKYYDRLKDIIEYGELKNDNL